MRRYCILFVFAVSTSVFANPVNESKTRSPYSKAELTIEKVQIHPLDLDPLVESEDFQAVHFRLLAKTPDGKSRVYEDEMAFYTKRNSGIWSSKIFAVSMDALYMFSNVEDYRTGNVEAIIGYINSDDSVEPLPTFETYAELVDYDPSVFDKLISWLISGGAGFPRKTTFVNLLFIEN